MKKRPFDEALDAIERQMSFLEVARGMEHLDGEKMSRRMAELSAAARVLRAAGQYTTDDDGTAWSRLVRAILAARRLEEKIHD